MTSPRVDGILGPWDPTEVRTQDDLAAHRADEFLAMAMLDQSQRVRAQGHLPRGVCAYCEGQCHPMAVYCDADCRDGHELEQAARARQGRGG